MARSIWTGVLGFGMVSIPIKLFVATEDKDISFNQLHKSCKCRINQIKVCKKCDETVGLGPDDIVKGFEYAKGNYIVMDEHDLDNLPLTTKKLISIESFINVDEIDPIHYEKTYYLEPELQSAKPFALFVQSLKNKNRAGIARFALRTKERICLLRVRGNRLLLTTMLYPDEVRIDDGKEVMFPTLTPEESAMGEMLVDMMTKPFNPSNITDRYRDALLKVIEAKLEGRSMEDVVPTALKDAGSLMDALTATMEMMKKSNV